MRLGFILIAVMLSGCAAGNEMDFNKPLIPIPEKKETTLPEEKVWIEAKTSRVWVNSHIDESGDLIDGHYKHIVTEAGHWEVKANERKR